MYNSTSWPDLPFPCGIELDSEMEISTLQGSEPTLPQIPVDLGTDVPLTPDGLFEHPKINTTQNPMEGYPIDTVNLPLTAPMAQQMIDMNYPMEMVQNHYYGQNDTNLDNGVKRRKISRPNQAFYAPTTQIPTNQVFLVNQYYTYGTLHNRDPYWPYNVALRPERSISPCRKDIRLIINCPDAIWREFRKWEFRTSGVVVEQDGYLVIDMTVLHNFVENQYDYPIDKARLVEKFHPSKQFNQEDLEIEGRKIKVNKFLKVNKNNILMNNQTEHVKNSIKIAVARIKSKYNDQVRIFTRYDWGVIPFDQFIYKS